jgi:hypothetical protein
MFFAELGMRGSPLLSMFASACSMHVINPVCNALLLANEYTPSEKKRRVLPLKY